MMAVPTQTTTSPADEKKVAVAMANTFDAVPLSRHERSHAYLEVSEPAERLERIMEQAQLHRGSLREQDGYTIPFREGGQVRIRIHEQGEGEHGPGLAFLVDAPTEERRTYIEMDIADTARTQLTDEAELVWQRD